MSRRDWLIDDDEEMVAFSFARTVLRHYLFDDHNPMTLEIEQSLKTMIAKHPLIWKRMFSISCLRTYINLSVNHICQKNAEAKLFRLL